MSLSVLKRICHCPSSASQRIPNGCCTVTPFFCAAICACSVKYAILLALLILDLLAKASLPVSVLIGATADIACSLDLSVVFDLPFSSLLPSLPSNPTPTCITG